MELHDLIVELFVGLYNCLRCINMFRCHLLVVMAGMPEIAVRAMKDASIPENCQVEFEVAASLADLPPMAGRKCAALLLNTVADWEPAQIDAQFGRDTRLVICTDRLDELSPDKIARACRVWPLTKIDNYWPFFCQHLLEDLYKQKELWHTRNCLQTVVDTMPGFVWFKDMEGRHLKVNQAFCEMVGKSMQDVEGKEHYEIWGVTPEQYEEGEYVCLETDKAIADNPKPTLFQEQVLHSKLRLRKLETYKAPIFDEDGKMIGNIGVAKDVTEEYAYKERILLLSRTDELTKLANRRYFYQFVDMHRRKGNGELTLCYVDLDYFKQLNDTFGHQYGDAALMAIGELLTRAFPKDFIARLGGDELIVAIFAVPEREVLVDKLEKLYQSAREFFRHDICFQHLDMSIGVASTESHAVSLDTLLQRSDNALYYTKKNNRGKYTFYEDIKDKMTFQREFHQ